MTKQMKANGMLILTAMIWGSTFVAQSSGMDYVGPFTFLMARFVLGGLALLPVIFCRNCKRPAAVHPPVSRRSAFFAGFLCGTALFAGSALQQIGLLYTSAGKSGFITTLYVVLVPVFSLFLRRRVGLNTWVSVAVAAAALYLLCINESFTIGTGELLTLACAFCFSLQILLIDHFAAQVDGVRLACTEFFVCAAWAALFAFLRETPSWTGILRSWLPICYAGILSSGVGYTFQIIAQRNTRPTVASLLMSLESVFAVIFGALLLQERLLPKVYLGCSLMFGAVVLAQLPQKHRPLASGWEKIA